MNDLNTHDAHTESLARARTDAACEHLPARDVPTQQPGFVRALRAAGRKGMTLIEIMIVITIMAAIMGVVGWAVIGQSDKAYVDLAESELNSLKNAVKNYYGQYRKMPESLDDLVDTPDGYKIIDEVPTDPWGNDYVLEKSGKTVKLYSPGPDETPNNDDDIVVELNP